MQIEGLRGDRGVGSDGLRRAGDLSAQGTQQREEARIGLQGDIGTERQEFRQDAGLHDLIADALFGPDKQAAALERRALPHGRREGAAILAVRGQLPAPLVVKRKTFGNRSYNRGSWRILCIRKLLNWRYSYFIPSRHS